LRADLHARRPRPGSGRQCFAVRSEHRRYVFEAPSAEVIEAWLDAFRHATTASIEAFELMTVIGRGGQGEVQIAKHRITKKVHAIKKLSTSQLLDDDVIERTFRERHILLTPKHPFLVSASSAFQNRTNVFVTKGRGGGGPVLLRRGCAGGSG